MVNKQPHKKPTLAKALRKAFRDDLDRGKNTSLDRELKAIKRLFGAFEKRSFDHKAIVEFFSYAFLHRDRRFSQLGQELWVLLMTGEKRAGYFVEFGACDGLHFSNSCLLERDYGWKGIVAEPNPHWHAALAENRRCSVTHECVSATSGDVVSFDCMDRPALSTLSGTNTQDMHRRKVRKRIDVSTISLNDLLDSHDAPAVVDYISIDTEGSELMILEAFDFSRRQVDFFTVEHNYNEARRDAVLTLMEANGFRRWYPEITRFDDWFVNRDCVDDRGARIA